jgi:hypothetical protein
MPSISLEGSLGRCLTADIAIPGTGGDAHRKAVLMIRQSLDADSPYADAALHGSGLTSLQSRSDKGGIAKLDSIERADDTGRGEDATDDDPPF